MAVNLRFFTVCRPLPGDSSATRRRNLLLPAAGNREISPSAKIPARDRVIDFGKYKGRLLGTLPSSYLRWISRNLRAGDTLEWAHLADQVLVDDFYKDRLEWESAHRLLTGDNGADFHRRPVNSSPPSAALDDLTRHFGWDNEDRDGWRRVDFELLGTSGGGRIPRKGDSLAAPPVGEKVGRLSNGPSFSGGEEEAAEENKREQRRLRARMKREQRMRELKRDLGLAEAPVTTERAEKGGAAVLKSHAHLRGLLNKIRGREP